MSMSFHRNFNGIAGRQCIHTHWYVQLRRHSYIQYMYSIYFHYRVLCVCAWKVENKTKSLIVGKYSHTSAELVCICERDYSMAHNLHCFMVAKFVICSCVNVLPVRLQWQRKIPNFRNVGENNKNMAGKTTKPLLFGWCSLFYISFDFCEIGGGGGSK